MFEKRHVEVILKSWFRSQLIIQDTQYFSFINTICHSARGVRHEIRPIGTSISLEGRLGCWKFRR